jgi:hypothetical protein
MRTFGLRLFIVSLAAVTSAPALAQSDSSEAKLVSKADKSGTNPINFTNDLRAYYEYQELSGGGEGHVGTLEGRTPVFDGKVQVRVRVPFKALDFDVGGMNISESGLGDINARLLTVPYLDPKNGLALAAGLEMFFPTAGDDVLGEGKFSLGPQIFGVKFAPFGIKGSLIAPAVQQVFSVAGEGDRTDVNRTQFDVFILKQSDDAHPLFSSLIRHAFEMVERSSLLVSAMRSVQLNLDSEFHEARHARDRGPIAQLA